jgi:hypothetical protein
MPQSPKPTKLSLTSVEHQVLVQWLDYLIECDRGGQPADRGYPRPDRDAIEFLRDIRKKL